MNEPSANLPAALTVDLDDGEPPWLFRVVGVLERMLQSGFTQDQQTNDDIERLIGVLKDVYELKT